MCERLMEMTDMWRTYEKSLFVRNAIWFMNDICLWMSSWDWNPNASIYYQMYEEIG